MSKFTISAESLLSAYNGKYKYVTMDKNLVIHVWDNEPYKEKSEWQSDVGRVIRLGQIAIAEFQGKDWQECIYKAKPSEEEMIGCVGWFWDNEENKKLNI